MYDSSITSQIPGLIHGMVMIFIFDCVTLQTSHTTLYVVKVFVTPQLFGCHEVIIPRDMLLYHLIFLT